jgi:hypothetical protein
LAGDGAGRSVIETDWLAFFFFFVAIHNTRMKFQITTGRARTYQIVSKKESYLAFTLPTFD